MPLPKPSSFPDWTETNPGVRVEPSAAKKIVGWASNERPPFEFMNWLFYIVDSWIKYFESVTDDFTNGNIVVVNSDPALGNFETLQDAIDDAGTVPGTKILVTSDLEISANVQISKQDIEIEFRPGVVLSKAVGAPNGLRAFEVISSADRVRLKHCRIEGFDGAGDTALWLDVGADNVFLFNMIYGAAQTLNFNANANSTYVELATMDL